MVEVWKFPLTSGPGLVNIAMPVGHEILSVGIQDGIMLWARVETTAEPQRVGFIVVGTGHPAPGFNEGLFVGTVFDGPFVWHVFKKVASNG